MNYYDKDELMLAIKDALARHYCRTDWDNADDYNKEAGCNCNGRWLSLEKVVDVLDEAL